MTIILPDCQPEMVYDLLRMLYSDSNQTNQWPSPDILTHLGIGHFPEKSKSYVPHTIFAKPEPIENRIDMRYSAGNKPNNKNSGGENYDLFGFINKYELKNSLEIKLEEPQIQ